MRQTLWVAAGVVGGLLIGTAAGGARQDPPPTFPRPTFDTGPVKVQGSVVVTSGEISIANVPLVQALQEGPWEVTLRAPVALAAPVRVVAGPPAAIKPGARYAVTWADGTRAVLRVIATGDDGWIDAEPDDGTGRGWFNVAQARAIRAVGAR
jgi:hypothetical protein